MLDFVFPRTPVGKIPSKPSAAIFPSAQDYQAMHLTASPVFEEDSLDCEISITDLKDTDSLLDSFFHEN